MSMVMDEGAVYKINKPRLKPERTRENILNEQLVALIRAGENEKDNMLQLWQQNKGFIYKMARKYSGYAEMDDLMQEGYLGLYEAVRHYEPDQNSSFIHYAAFWIRQIMQRYVDNCSSVVRIPVHAKEDIREYRKVVREYQKYYGCEPSERELCAILCVDREKLHAIQQNVRMGQIGSLSEPVGGEDDDIMVCDTVASGEDIEEDVISELDRENMKRELWIAVDQLPDNLPEVIRHRYIDGMTLKETGQRMGVGIERVRQIEAKAMRTLRSPRRYRTFRAYYEEYIESCSYRHVGVRSFQNTWLSEVEREVLGG